MKVKCIPPIDAELDDHDMLLAAVSEVDSTVNTMSAKDGVEASPMLGRAGHKPNRIFLNLNMPRMDGREFLTKIKKEEALKDIPVIVYTTSTLEKDRDETQQLGAAHFISKPSLFEELCKQIESALQRDWKI